MPDVVTVTGGLDVKADFPIFTRRFDGRELIYLDSGATSQKPAVVIEALASHLREHNANVHRGVYTLAQEADAAYDDARKQVAAFVNAEPETTIFCKNVTEAINLVAYTWDEARHRRVSTAAGRVAPLEARAGAALVRPRARTRTAARTSAPATRC